MTQFCNDNDFVRVVNPYLEFFFSTCLRKHWVELSIVTHEIIEDEKKRRKSENSDAFSNMEHRHDNLVASFEYARVNKSIILLQRTSEKSPHPSTSYPAKKTQVESLTQLRNTQ